MFCERSAIMLCASAVHVAEPEQLIGASRGEDTMKANPQRPCSSVFVCALMAVATAAYAQTPEFLSGDVVNAPVVAGAPYSGEAVTMVQATLFDGTRIDRSVTVKVYRDSAGRVRREQAAVGFEALDPSTDFRAVVTIVDPVAAVVYSLNPATQTAVRVRLAAVRTPPITPRLQSEEEPLGTRDIDGIASIGRRIVTTIPAGQAGTDRPIVVSDERWESPELKVLLLARHHNPRSGDVEYRVTRLTREEPRPELFAVPSDYTFTELPEGLFP
jgi:hypothetical protein